MSTTLTAPWLLPADEAERLHTLHRYTSPCCLYEPVLTGFIDLAAQIFALPLSFISLVDADEVTYKIGLGLTHLPRVAAVCALTVRLNDTLVFTDLAQQNQYGRLTSAAAAEMAAYGLRFYASIPVRMPDQRPIGTLCVAGNQPRDFNLEEQQLVEQITELVAQTLVTRQLCLTSDWLGEEHWLHIQTTLIEDLWELAALVRYLLQRSGPQVPVAPEVLTQVSRRLTDLLSILTVHPSNKLR